MSLIVQKFGGTSVATSETIMGAARKAIRAQQQGHQVADLLVQFPRAQIATLASPLQSREEYFDPNVVKLVTDREGRALYFSRAPIPWSRDQLHLDTPAQFGARRHIGLYAYRVGALRRLAALEPAPLEQTEKLEQLRALFHGLEIRVGEADCRPGPDVNTPEDLARAAAALAATT